MSLLIAKNSNVSNKGPLLETLEFFAISHGRFQPLNFLNCSTLSTQYPIVESLACFVKGNGLAERLLMKKYDYLQWSST